MLADIIKYFIIYFCAILICLKILNILKIQVAYILRFGLLSICLAFLSYNFFIYITSFTFAIPLLCIWILITLHTEQPKLTLIATIISFAVSYSLLAFSSFFVVIIASPFRSLFHTLPRIVIAIFTCALELVFTTLLLQINRFKKGMPFLGSTSFLNITTILSTLFLAASTYIPSFYGDVKLMTLSFIIFITLFISILHWWQAQITKSYKHALVQRELESLRTELQEKDRLLAEMSAKNEELGRLIHKDNKRIPAMEHAVSEFLVMDFVDKETAIERANTLLLEIKELAQDRDNTITEIYASKFKHHNTGINSLDTMLNYMEKRAHNEHIKLSVNIAFDLNSFIPDTIATEDLTHVLSDLLENAIIATKQNASPVIQLQFYQAGKDFVIEIADNGNPFEANILVNYGLEQLTTHADTGGSGIGLMDIWKIKEKYGTSLHITEYENDAPYTKKIALIFNKKNRYTISTTRKDALMQLSKRTDLQIF